ncbi:MAG TPA: fused MFS/spermidine synthase [Candidatus Paceibacterota bacterium]|nr:fused MFS/spermidine synthase [Candidatus Paceibacterota bacterium]
MPKLARLFLYSTVFLTGAAVLIMEVAAIRFLTPYYGSSLYVLSSVLTVVLFALSLGYYYGGKLSDRFPFVVPLYIIITAGGLFLLALTLLSTYLLPLSADGFSIMTGPLVFAILFYFAPAFLLGIDSPYVIKLLSQNSDTSVSGSVVGATFFWSTAGSITGSLLSGFVLIPLLGLRETMILTGVILTILGLSGAIGLRVFIKKSNAYDPRNDLNLKPLLLLALILLSALVYFLVTTKTSASDLVSKDGYYSHLRVFDGYREDVPTRFLKREVNHSAAIYLNSDKLVYPYAKFAFFYKELVPEAKTVLHLGGGAYTVPRALYLDNPNLQQDVVEIEPELYAIAKKYFRLPSTPQIKNHAMDARVFVNRNHSKYDFIFVDVFSSGFFTPPHLVTKEFFTSLKKSLSVDGVIIMNFIGSRSGTENQTLTGSFTKTVTAVFPTTKIYTTRLILPELSQNLMYFMRHDDKEISFSNFISTQTDTGVEVLNNLYIDPTSLISAADVVFEDNHSPVELLLLQENLNQKTP